MISTKVLLDLTGSPLSKAITNNWQRQESTPVTRQKKNTTLWLSCKQTYGAQIFPFFEVADGLFRDARHRNGDLQETDLAGCLQSSQRACTHVLIYTETGESRDCGRSMVVVESQTVRCLKSKTKATHISEINKYSEQGVKYKVGTKEVKPY